MSSRQSFLYIWAGQDPSVANAADFVAVIDFSENSAKYGSIVRVARLVSNPASGIGQANNEPHHASVSSNKRYYITGGLLSFLSNQKEIFVWEIPQNPGDGPRLVCTIDAPGSACPDEFQPIGGSSFLVTMMCNESAGSPGDLVVIDASECTARSLLQNRASLQNFNPHGYGRLSNGAIFVADYILPSTLAGTDPSQIVFRNTIRQFSSGGRLERIYDLPLPVRGNSTELGTGVGPMELKSIPQDPLGRSYTLGTNTNFIYLITPGNSEPLIVLDVSVVNGYVKRPGADMISIFPTGKHALITSQMRFVILLDISEPETPKILHTFDFCTDSSIRNLPIGVPGANTATTFPQFCAANSNLVGAHVIVHPSGENRFVVVNYFLKFGLAQFIGTRSVHAFKLNRDLSGFRYDHRFNPNFVGTGSTVQTFHSLRAYPHHAQYLRH